jgi:hexosaminidase
MHKAAGFLVAISAIACAQDLMPVPAALTRGSGTLAIDAGFRIALEGYREPRLGAAAARTVARLSRQTGILIRGTDAAARLVVECKGASAPVQTVREDESYTLNITPQQARLQAATPLGVLRGFETFLQLVAPAPGGFAVPVLRIDDKPRFPWRGLMLDSARHFQPLPMIERNLDAMAAVKLNVFHWHLSDNQGFRVESKVFPDLQAKGSDGLYYTQDQIRAIIAYARERGIRVVPEFDMPGHTTAWFVGYPELASAPGPYTIERGWGVFDPAMDPTRETTYEFLDRFIAEMAVLFPDEYLHIGGDEVNGKAWESSPRIQEFMRAHGMKKPEELQALFIKRVVALVIQHGKKPVGWDEVLDPTLPKDVVVHSWRGRKSLAEAARKGYQGLLSFGYYLDLMQSTAYHYANDPLGAEAAKLGEAEKARILGGEACEWSEMATAEIIEARIWPRLAAIAERLWSPQEVKDEASMYRRMEIESRRLEWLGLEHRIASARMFDRIAAYEPHDAEALEALATAVEPLKQYDRHDVRKYDLYTPLNRMVDAAPADSVTARSFARSVHAFLAGDRTKEEEIRKLAAAWNQQHATLKNAFTGSFLAAELEPVSRNVSRLGAIVLGAIGILNSGKPAPEHWVAQQKRIIEQSKKPQAELLIVILDPVTKIVEAAAAQK